MESTTALSTNGVERLALKAYSEKAYLNYSMYVILDRALPHLGDGLKPVQRRIIYAMSELSLAAPAKHKKSARAIGDVIGKYHPHGEAACYEAMVLMAQPFSYRYPLVDGQGNFGSPDDPKSFAAMRYTESRLTPFAETLLAEVDQGTVDWGPNFDGTMQEPGLLPSRLPNILLNGATGIAVGMATDIPPHNLQEVAQACMHLLDHPDATVEALCAYILGPDFPTEAEIITPRHDLIRLYETGSGSIRLRARYVREQDDIVVTALPYQVSGAKVIEQMAAQIRAKKLPMVDDVRDESDHEHPTRLVIVLHSVREDVEALMAHLFATTELERTYRVNFNMIGLDGRPQVKNLRTLLTEWITFRTQTVQRRLQFRLERVRTRLHIVEGLFIAYQHLDEVIAIIRTVEQPQAALCQRFALSPEQAEAILELRLRRLGALEEQQLSNERKTLTAERDRLDKILASPRRLHRLMRSELEKDAKQYGDARRSPLVERGPAQAMDATVLVASEPVTVILSEKGWVRAAKGHDIDAAALSYKAGDTFKAAVRGRSDQLVVFLDSSGRTYALPAHTLPSARGQGEPLSSRLSPPDGATFVGLMLGQDEDVYLLASTAGYGFLVTLSELYIRNKAGKVVLVMPPSAEVLSPVLIRDSTTAMVVVISKAGRLLVFPVQHLAMLAKGKGYKLIGIPAEQVTEQLDGVSLLTCVPGNTALKLWGGQRHLTLKPTDVARYTGVRGQRGSKLPRGFQRIERVEVVDAAIAATAPPLV